MKKHQTSDAIGTPYGHVATVNGDTDLEYKTGFFTFKQGIVRIYSGIGFATFIFVFNERIHKLSLSDLKKPLTERQLILHAGKFARKVVSAQQTPSPRLGP